MQNSHFPLPEHWGKTCIFPEVSCFTFEPSPSVRHRLTCSGSLCPPHANAMYWPPPQLTGWKILALGSANRIILPVPSTPPHIKSPANTCFLLLAHPKK